MLRNAGIKEDTGAYALYHGDGLLDIFIGLGILLFGAGILVEMPWLVAIFPATLWPVWQDVKKSLTVPRLKRAGFAPPPDAEQKRRFAATILVGLVTLVLGVGVALLFVMDAVPAAARTWLTQHFALAFGGFLAILTGVVGGLFRARRFYAYAALTLVVFAAAQWLGLSLPIATVISGAAILLIGLGVLIRFARTYPAQDDGR